MPLQGSDIIARTRRYYAEPSENRWSDSDILSFASDIQIEVAQAVKFLSATTIIAGSANIGQYPMPELIKILRVYAQVGTISQQRLVPSDIDVMEGTYIEYFDNTSGNTTNVLQMSPQWIAEQAQPYPNFNSPEGGSTPNAPYMTVTLGAQRPVYFRRGGTINIEPVPTAAFNLVIDHIPIPPDVQLAGDYFALPRNFRDAIAFGVCTRMSGSDRGFDDPRTAKFLEQYGIAVMTQREWLNQLDGDKPVTPIPITQRSFTRYEDNC